MKKSNTQKFNLNEIKFSNWKNFQNQEILLSKRNFLLGDMGTGKSNVVDSLCFIRDIFNKNIGLQHAIDRRGGFNKIKNANAKDEESIQISIKFTDFDNNKWSYSLGVNLNDDDIKTACITSETIKKNNVNIYHKKLDKNKIDEVEKTKPAALDENINSEFRAIFDFFQSFKFLNVSPHVTKNRNLIDSNIQGLDIYNEDFINNIKTTNKTNRNKRLKKLNTMLKKTGIFDRFSKRTKIAFSVCESNFGHIELIAKTKDDEFKINESQMSSGQLQLLSILWFLTGDETLLIFEEPEKHLNERIIEDIPNIFLDVIEENGKQITSITNSFSMLVDLDIEYSECILFEKGKNDTKIKNCDDIKKIKQHKKSDKSIAHAILENSKSASKNNENNTGR